MSYEKRHLKKNSSNNIEIVIQFHEKKKVLTPAVNNLQLVIISTMFILCNMYKMINLQRTKSSINLDFGTGFVLSAATLVFACSST